MQMDVNLVKRVKLLITLYIYVVEKEKLLNKKINAIL